MNYGSLTQWNNTQPLKIMRQLYTNGPGKIHGERKKKGEEHCVHHTPMLEGA